MNLLVGSGTKAAPSTLNPSPRLPDPWNSHDDIMVAILLLFVCQASRAQT